MILFIHYLTQMYNESFQHISNRTRSQTLAARMGNAVIVANRRRAMLHDPIEIDLTGFDDAPNNPQAEIDLIDEEYTVEVSISTDDDDITVKEEPELEEGSYDFGDLIDDDGV